MALIGVARAFDIDFGPYLSDYGTKMFAAMRDLPIGAVLGQYPDYRFAKLVKPEYADPSSIKPFVDAANAHNMGSAPSPTIPMQIRQGAGGELEGTRGDKPGIGAGDGVMIAGDVRTLARQYCAAGTPVDHLQHDALSHTPGAVPWLAEAVPFLAARFAGLPPTNTCATIAPGNSLAPEVFRGAAVPSAAAGPAPTRTRVRLSRGRPVHGRVASTVAFSVVSTAPTSGGARAGRVEVRVDGAFLRRAGVAVTRKAGRTIHGMRVPLPRSLGYGAHRITVRFTPADPAAYAGSRSRTVRLDVVRARGSR